MNTRHPFRWFWLTFTVACLTVLLLANKAATRPQGATANANVQTSGGLTVVTFTVEAGRIKVNLPDDIRTGDTISGTVICEPKGTTKEERRSNEELLDQLRIRIKFSNLPEEKPKEVGCRDVAVPFTGVYLNDEKATGLMLELFKKLGEALAQAKVAVPTHPSGAVITPDPKITVPMTPSGAVITPNPKTTANAGYYIPPLGQQGRPVVIDGPFDGNSANTGVKVGNVDAKVLAETPRKLIVASPSNVLGPTQIKITDQGNSTTGGFRNLKIDLTAPKTSLLKGESTELRVTVDGLAGLTEPVNVQLQNQSPSTVNLSGGNTQTMTISPSAVSSNGSFVVTQTITGITAGSFNITSTVSQPIQTVAQAQPSSTPASGTGQPTQTTGSQTLGPSPSTGNPTTSPTTPQTKSGTTSITGAAGGNKVTVTGAGGQEPGQGGAATFSSAETDCCKKIRAQNGGRLRFMKDGNGFELLGNKLVMTVGGKTYEWLFTQADGSELNLEYIFCHLTTNQILSQLTQAMVSRVSGGTVVEKGKTESVSVAGPSPGETSTRPFYSFQFTFQNVDSGEKEYAISFFMDAEKCTWTMQLFENGQTTWSATHPARSLNDIRQDTSNMGTLPDKETVSGGRLQQSRADQPFEKGEWWGYMYRYLGEILEWYAWVEGDPEGKKQQGSLVAQTPFRSWVVAAKQSLIRLRNDFDKDLTADDKKLIDEMVNMLSDENSASPTAEYIHKVMLKFNKLWERYNRGVPPPIEGAL